MRAQQSGSIINVSSIWGIAGAAGVAAYTASQGCSSADEQERRLSYVDDGIRVNSLHPGIVATPMIERKNVPSPPASSTPPR